MKEHEDYYTLLERIALSQMQYGQNWQQHAMQLVPKVAWVLPLTQGRDLKLLYTYFLNSLLVYPLRLLNSFVKIVHGDTRVRSAYRYEQGPIE